MDEIRSKIEHQLDEMMMGAENCFGAVNPKRAGHIHCALERIMEILNADSGSPSRGSVASINGQSGIMK